MKHDNKITLSNIVYNMSLPNIWQASRGIFHEDHGQIGSTIVGVYRALRDDEDTDNIDVKIIKSYSLEDFVIREHRVQTLFEVNE